MPDARSIADIRRQTDALLADVARQVAELYAAAAGPPAAPLPLTEKAAAAAAYIRRHPGRAGSEVAAAVGLEPASFRRHVVPALKTHGLVGSKTHGYRFADV